MIDKISLAICFLFLLIEGIADKRNNIIPILPAGVCMLAGLVFGILRGRETLISIILGALLGGIVILLAQATKEKIGYGDGLVLVATGLLLGFRRNLLLLLFSLFLSALAGIWILLSRRGNRNTKMAFVPFMLPALTLTIACTEGGIIL
ncbi:MAG: prepilin peptidase [Lachnospiraceae bacterium]|nr:prepilin peptidase [Lachnospiraceae bacterium]